MKPVPRLTVLFLVSLFVVITLFILPRVSHADNKKGIDDTGNQKGQNTITLSWENPEEGTAVSFYSEKEYTKAPPLLLSSQTIPVSIKTSINMSPVLQRLILPGSETDEAISPEENSDDVIGNRAAQKALEFYENKVRTVNVNGVVLNIETDCSYFVRAAYWEGSDHTRDLFMESLSTKSVDPNKATGVTLLSSYFQKHHRYQSGTPRIGDIIIFDNTYDKNHNQQRDDYYTHTGIVTGIRDDKTIEFIHGNISRTVKKGYINFEYKNTSVKNQKQVNSYIRPRYTWEQDTTQSLASYLVRAFGGY